MDSEWKKTGNGKREKGNGESNSGKREMGNGK
jgi:hypothetical protein